MKFFNRLIKRPNWHNMRTTKPVSNLFGFDRGTPVDRYYIEKFLTQNAHRIQGRTLEIENDHYSKKLGTHVIASEILHFTADNPKATIIGDLTKKETLPENFIDCFICTQTFNFIYDFKEAIKGAHHLLKNDGVLLATVAGLCQVSQYDMERWGDFWRFTTQSALVAFGEVFGNNNVTVGHYGNVLSATALLHGISTEELTPAELDISDPVYQVLITVVARKC